MNESEKLAAIEALLFFYGEPIAFAKMAKITGFTEKECDALVVALAQKLSADPERGLMMIEEGRSVQLATKPNLAWLTKKLVESEFKEELTPAAIEALSLVAYLGPVPRSTIDYIRGVNSTFMLRHLLIRGLVTRELEAGKKNVYEYSVSFDFLKHMGVKSVRDLPEYEKYQGILKQFESESEPQSAKE